tara:strand:+ start:628 stop:879 length:252 start_codon:yes stop_codon:yes gene_type:complete
MKLQSLAQNRTVLIFNNGTTEIFFSYETPVAGYSDKLGYIKTDQWYSSTTTRHINKYLGDLKHSVVSQSVIDDLLKEQVPTRY